MASAFNFTTALTEPNLGKAKIVKITEIDLDNKSISFNVQLSGSGIVHPAIYRFQVKQDLVSFLIQNPTPTTILDEVAFGTLLASPQTAFNTVYGVLTDTDAGHAANRLGSMLAALATISGVVQSTDNVTSAGLVGTTISAFPPGTAA